MPAQNKRKRGDSLGVDQKKANENTLLQAAKVGALRRLLKKYLRSCRPSPDADPKKDPGRLPNLAGFCASLGCGTASVSRLREIYPQHYDYLCAVMEDEVLNSVRSPALLNSYLKERLGYGEKGNSEHTEEIPLPIFEHDILEDGA